MRVPESCILGPTIKPLQHLSQVQLEIGKLSWVSRGVQTKAIRISCLDREYKDARVSAKSAVGEHM